MEKYKRYILTFEVEIEAEDIDEAEGLAQAMEVRRCARLVTIRCEEEDFEKFYGSE
jgi:hypothetical protein